MLSALLSGSDLDLTSAGWAMDQIMTGEASPAQVAGFLMALRAKGETIAELRGIADTMLRHAHRIEVPEPSLDIVGTGGDRAHTVNISTMAAVTAASVGVTVVKHGNRAASSSSGTADVLEALGVNLTLDPDRVAQLAQECGITFCFAQVFHPAMRHAAPTRRELGVPTVFNVLGPMTNPAQPTYAAVGVADARLAPLVAGVFADRGKDTVVFRGDDGLDELTIATTSTLWWAGSNGVNRFVVDPARLGLDLNPLSTLRGRDPQYNAAVVRAVFGAERGPVRDAVALNTGAALALVAGLRPATQDEFDDALRDGISRAEQALDTGLATAKLEEWVAATGR